MTQLSVPFNQQSSVSTLLGRKTRRISALMVSMAICFITLIVLYSFLDFQDALAQNSPPLVQIGEDKALPMGEKKDVNTNANDIFPPSNDSGMDLFASLAPNATLEAQAQTTNDLIVTGGITVYVDDDRYAVTSLLNAGDLTVPITSGINIVAGDEILIINMLGSDTGRYETAVVAIADTDVLTLSTPLIHAYDGTTDKIMVQRIPHYNEVVVEDGTLTARAWDGQTGGVVFFRAVTVTIETTGTIDVTGLGYRGGAISPDVAESEHEPIPSATTIPPYPGEGPGGGEAGVNYWYDATSGGGGSYATVGGIGHKGSNGVDAWNIAGSPAGATYGDPSLERLYLGSGGGAGGRQIRYGKSGRPGQAGGGIIFVQAQSSWENNGSVISNGLDALDKNECYNWDQGGSGAGAGGSIHIVAPNTAVDGDIQTQGGSSTLSNNDECGTGGKGGNGYILFDTDTPIQGLVASNNSPTLLRNATMLTATITGGTNVIYEWSFEDGSPNGSGPSVPHVYTEVGSYTAVITASNSANTVTATTPVTIVPPIPTADLQITKTGPISIEAGAIINYAITVTNQGPDQATGVLVTDTLPASLTPVGPDDYTYHADNHTVVWSLGLLASGESKVLTLQAQVAVGASSPIENSVTVTAGQVDETPINNTAISSTPIAPPIIGPDLYVSKTGPDTVLTGFPITYQVTIANQGDTLATGVVITDTLPPYVTYVSSSHPSASTVYDANTNTVVWTIGSLIANGSYNITLGGTVSSTAPTGYISNQVVGTLNETDANTSNNQNYHSTEVLAPTANLVITPSSSDKNPAVLSVQEGSLATMVISITNNGTGSLAGDLTLSRSSEVQDINYDWLSVTPMSVSNLAIGETVTFTLSVDTSNVAAGLYNDLLVFETPGDSSVADQPLYLRVHVHPQLVTFTVPVTNSLGNPVSGATVAFTKQVSRVVSYNGVDASPSHPHTYFSQKRTAASDGVATMTDMEVGTYDYVVSAAGHRSVTGTFTVASGTTTFNNLNPLLALPGLVFEPNQASLSVTAGESNFATLHIRNLGPGVAEDFSVGTPTDLPWVSSALPYNVTQLGVGESMSVTLLVNPPASTDIQTYERYITVAARNVATATLAASINVVDEITSGLAFSITNKSSVPIQNATVNIMNQTGRVIDGPGGSRTVYDSQTAQVAADGTVQFDQLPPANYRYSVQANGYTQDTGSIQVQPGQPNSFLNINQVNTILGIDPLIIDYSITPFTFEDRYTVTMSVDYATGLDEPALFVSPSFVCDGNWLLVNMGTVTLTNINLSPQFSGYSFSPLSSLSLDPGNSAVVTYQYSETSDAKDPAGRVYATATADSEPYSTSAPIDACGENIVEGWTWEWDGSTAHGSMGATSMPPSFPSQNGSGNLSDSFGEGVDDKSTLQLSGGATLERQAFLASLYMASNTDDDYLDMTADFEIRDDTGLPIINAFAITPTLPTNIGSMTEPGDSLSQEWVIVPNDLGITDTNGELFDIRAQFTTTLNGSPLEIQTAPQSIRIYPQPKVRLSFSHSQPDDNGSFFIEVAAQNDGYGIARNLNLDLSNINTLGDIDGNGRSLQFSLMGTTIDGNVVPGNSYTFNFGDLGPGETRVGRWSIAVTPSDGLPLHDPIITGLRVSCGHLDYMGMQLTPLIVDCGAEVQTFYGPECPFCSGGITKGGPINIANGNYDYRQSTPAIPTVSDPLQLTWSYNSLNTGVSPDIPIISSTLGVGWTHNYNMYLDLSHADDEVGEITFVAPAGTPMKFLVVRDDEYRPAPGVWGDLERSGTDYVLTARDQSVYTFDDAGQLMSQMDPQGNPIVYSYNGNGRLDLISEPVSGRFLDLAYDANGRLESVTDPINRTTVFGYNGLDHLTDVTDTRGKVWTYQYTQLASGDYLLSTIIDPEDRTLEHTTFDDLGRATSQTYEGHTFEIAYHENGRRVITDGIGTAASLIYNNQGLLVAGQDALGNIEKFVLDRHFNRVYVEDKMGTPQWGEQSAFGKPISQTNALGHTAQNVYDDQNNLLRSTDTMDFTSSYGYENNNLITDTNHLNATIYYDYNPHGQVISQTSRNDLTTKYGYDSLGQLTVITNSLGLTTHYEYDDVGRTVTTTDTSGNITVNTYDKADNLIAVTSNYLPGQPANYLGKYNRTTRYGYDDGGLQTTITNTMGQVNLTLFDEYGRVVTRVTNYDGATPFNLLCTDFTNPDPEQNICSLSAYNDIGKVVATTNSMGIVNVTEYDKMGRVERTVSNWVDGEFDPDYPDEDIENHTQYDELGNTTITTNTLGQMTRHFYDVLLRPVGSIANWSGTINSFEELPTCFTLPEFRDTDICSMREYDALGQTIIVTDTVGRMTRSFYNELNQLEATVTNWNPATLASPDDCVIDPDNVNEENICTLYGYDPIGRQITTTNALAQTSLTVFDAQGRSFLTVSNWDGTTINDESDCSFPASPSDVNLCSVTFYDTDGRRSATQNAMGNLVSFEYDELGRVITTTRTLDGQPVRSVVGYDERGNQNTRTDAMGYKTTTTYDILNRVKTTTSAAGVVITRTYDVAGRVVSTTNNLNITTHTFYDDLGRVTGEKDGEDHLTTYIYDGLGNRQAVIDANSIRTSYGYDNLNRQISIIQNDTGGSQTVDSNIQTNYVYDALGNIRATVNAKSITTTQTSYDTLNRPITVSNALGYTTTTRYNALGNRVSVTDGNNEVTTYQYDGLNRVTDVIYEADGETITYGYDAAGQRIQMSDGLGSSSTQYDDLSRPVVVTDSLGTIVRYGYDLVNNPTKLTYPTGEVVTMTYDGDARLETVTDWSGGVTEYEYDAAGRLITQTLPNGVTSVGLYDKANRLTQLDHLNPVGALLGQYQYQYDDLGNTKKVTETFAMPGVTQLTNLFMESGGLVVMEAEHGQIDNGTTRQWVSQTVQTGYGGNSYLRALPDVGALAAAGDDPHSQYPVQITTPATYTLWLRGMSPDAAGDSIHVGVNDQPTDAPVSGFSANQWGWSSLTMSNTQAILDLTSTGTYTIDLWMREDGMRVDRLLLVTDTTYLPSGTGPAESVRDTTTVTGTTSTAQTVTYGYDDMNRLTSAVYGGDLSASYGYSYNELGYRMAYTATITSTVVTTYTYDNAGQLATAKASDSADTWHYEYDGNGNQLRQVPGGLTPADGEIQYSFNQRSQLVQVQKHDGTAYQLQAEMAYDGQGNRLRTVGYAEGQVYTTTYTLAVDGTTLQSSSGGSSTLVLYGQYAISQYQAGQWRYFLGDADLSVRQMIDAAGDVTLARTYAPFGILLTEQGEGDSFYGYRGSQSGANGLLYFEGGYYDPQTGRFISQAGENPLLPLAAAALANPGGLLAVPVLMINRRKRKWKKRDTAALLLLGVMFTLTLAGCSSDPSTPTPVVDNNPPVTDPEPSTTPEPGSSDPTAPGVGDPGETTTPTSTPCVTPAATNTPNPAPPSPTPNPTDPPETSTTTIPTETPTPDLEMEFDSSEAGIRGRNTLTVYNKYQEEFKTRFGRRMTLVDIVAITYANEFLNARVPEDVLVEATTRNLYQIYKQGAGGGSAIPINDVGTCKQDLFCDNGEKLLIVWLSTKQGWYEHFDDDELFDDYETKASYYDAVASDIVFPSDPGRTLGIEDNDEPWDWGNKNVDVVLAGKQFYQMQLGVWPELQAEPNPPCSHPAGYYYVDEVRGDKKDYDWFIVQTPNQQNRAGIPLAPNAEMCKFGEYQP